MNDSLAKLGKLRGAKFLIARESAVENALLLRTLCMLNLKLSDMSFSGGQSSSVRSIRSYGEGEAQAAQEGNCGSCG